MKKSLLPLLFLLAFCNAARTQDTDKYSRKCDSTFMRGDTLVCRRKVSDDFSVLKYYKNNKKLFVKTFRKEKNGDIEIVEHKKGALSKNHGEALILWPNGKIKARTWFVNGKQNGPSLSYYEDGKRQCVCRYKNGKRDGEQFIFWQTGQLYWNAVYEEGGLKEIKGFFDPLGSPLETGTFKDGNGTLFEYDDAGRKIGFWTYKDGKPTTKKVQKLSEQQ
jgi:antitoxin component YwqK of YwqJK toxin-antitoxin module